MDPVTARRPSTFPDPLAAVRALLCVILAALPGAALAQEPNPDPPTITVHPSEVLDEASDARRRQEALLRRRELSEYDFRSICRLCGSPERFDAGRPFEPYRALSAPPPRN